LAAETRDGVGDSWSAITCRSVSTASKLACWSRLIVWETTSRRAPRVVRFPCSVDGSAQSQFPISTACSNVRFRRDFPTRSCQGAVNQSPFIALTTVFFPKNVRFCRSVRCSLSIGVRGKDEAQAHQTSAVTTDSRLLNATRSDAPVARCRIAA
jgi:hypothetical protein